LNKQTTLHYGKFTSLFTSMLSSYLFSIII
jgi:hypothetical protein